MFVPESAETDDERRSKVPNGSHGNHHYDSSRMLFNGANSLNHSNNPLLYGLPPSLIPRLNSFPPTPSSGQPGTTPEQQAAAMARLQAAAGLALGSWPSFSHHLGQQQNLPGTTSNGCSSSHPSFPSHPLFPGSSFPLFPPFGFNLMDFSALRSLPHSRSPPMDKLPLDRPLLDRSSAMDRSLVDRPPMDRSPKDRSPPMLNRSPSSRSPIDRSPSEKLDRSPHSDHRSSSKDSRGSPPTNLQIS